MKIGIVGDYSSAYPSQKATEEALHHSSKHLGIPVEAEWLATALPEERVSEIADDFSGFWIAPGVPESPAGVYELIQYARENDIPLLGTCGGFQSILLEYARNVLGISDAEHEEQSPDAANPWISKLTCSLAGQQGEILIDPDSKVFGIYQSQTAVEQFRCSYGLNPEYRTKLDNTDLKIAGTDSNGEPRIVELSPHKFFVGTLYVPQLSSRTEAPHVLINSFVEEAYSGVRTCG